MQVLLAPGHGTVFRLLVTLNFVHDISYLRYLALASPPRSVIPVTMGPGPTKGRFTRQMSLFSLLGSKAQHTVRKLRPRLPPSCDWTSWQQLEGSWALGPP